MNEVKKNTTWLLAFSIVLTAGVFLLDLSLPLGVAGGVPYVVVVLLSLWFPRQRDTLIAAAVCTALTILGFYFSLSGSELWVVVFNRALAVFAIWTTAVFSLNRKRSREELGRHNDRLEDLVAERTVEVQESEEKYRLLTENMSDVIWTADSSGRFTYLSPSIEKLSGFKPEELVGLGIFELLAGKSIDFSKTLLRKTKEGEGDETTVQGELRT